MPGFSSSSCGSSKLWDPLETLGIINPDPEYQRITCVGYAPRPGRRCRVAINQYNRQTITNTLNEISYLHPSDPNVVSRLRGIAGTALCIRFHQNQASDILSQWRSKLPKVQRSDSEQKPRPSRSQARNQTSKDLQEQLRKLRELMNQLEEDLEAQKSDCCTDEESEEEPIYKDFQRAKARKMRDAEQAAYDEQSRQREQARATEAKARKEQERIERERINAERIKREAREAKEAAQKERIRRQRAQERAEQEAREREEKEEEAKRKRDAANSASNERIRQRARERAEKAAREKREKEEREQAEWKQAWTRYQDQWILFKTSPSQHGVLRNAIPWPVKTGLFSEVNASAVKAFLENALPAGTLRVKLLRKECQKWHPDVICRWSRAGELTDVERLMLDMICRVVTDQLNSSSGRSSEFL